MDVSVMSNPTNSGIPQVHGGRGGVERVIEHQRDRAQNFYNPLQQQIKHRSNHEPRGHGSPSRGHGSSSRVNMRNKFSRMSDVRQRHKQEQLLLKREKLVDQNDTHEYLKMLEANQNGDLEWDTLIDEERELQQVSKEEAALAELEAYEKELEEYFNDLTLE